MTSWTTHRRRTAILAALLATALTAGACGDDDDDDGGGGNTGGDTGGGGQQQEEPGPLNLEIQGANVPESGRPTVTFRVTDEAGAPVDLAGRIAAWNAAPQTFPNAVVRFTLAALQPDGTYTSYYESTATTAAGYTPPLPLAPGLTPGPAKQASYQPPPRNAQGPLPFPAADLRSVGNGVYELTLPETNVAGIERTRTHTVAGWIEGVGEQGGEEQIGHDSFNFVPAGGTPELDEVVTDAACNRCHGVLQAHGVRRGVQLCITCHSPQTTDPQTGRTQDFKSLIHKIHAGRDLPSVFQGFPYYIVGFQNSIHDYSNVAFPWNGGVAQCTACHQGEDGDNWRTKPSREACTTCHDNVKFGEEAAALPADQVCGRTLGAGENWYDDCRHPAIPRDNDPALCATCHDADAIAGYHGVHLPAAPAQPAR